MSVRYYTRQFNLAIARDNLEVDVTGGLLHALTATSRAAVLSVRFDGTANDLVTIKKGDGVEVKFKRIFLTNAAQPGETMDVLVVPDPKVFKLFQGAEIGDIDTVGTLGSITAPVDISDRAARVLGVADVSDRIARVLGVVKSITDPVTVSGSVDVKIIEGSAAWDQVGFDASQVNNPSSGTILANSGDLPVGLYFVEVTISISSPGKDVAFRWRDSVDATVETFQHSSTAAETVHSSYVLSLSANDDLVVILEATHTGRVSAAISWRRLKP